MLAPEIGPAAQRDTRLAPFREADISDEYVAWMRDPAVIRFTEVAPDSATLESCRAYVRTNNASDESLLWRILESREGHVGNIRLAISRKHQRGELALIVGRTDLHGRGIGTAAICLASDYAFATLGLHKLACGIYAGNRGSIAAFEKSGFRIEATFREHVRFDGRFEDVLRLARFAGDGLPA